MCPPAERTHISRFFQDQPSPSASRERLLETCLIPDFADSNGVDGTLLATFVNLALGAKEVTRCSGFFLLLLFLFLLSLLVLTLLFSFSLLSSSVSGLGLCLADLSPSARIVKCSSRSSSFALRGY